MSNPVIDTADQIRDLIYAIEASVPQPPFIFIDLEGVNLSRDGTVAIMQVLVPPSPQVHLVDIHTLNARAFTTPGGTGSLTLHSILSSERFAKVFFDVRRDSDALYSHFGIHLRGVVDLQLVEFATRPARGRFLKGLARCISEAPFLSASDTRRWNEVKDAGMRMFAPERGGSYDVFLQRPLPPLLVTYCVQDVLYMPRLLRRYAERLHHRTAAQVHVETLNRIVLSQSPGFVGNGRHMAIGPSFASSARSATNMVLPFPINVVCSAELARYCVLNEPSAVVTPPSTKTNNNDNDNDNIAERAAAVATTDLPASSTTEEEEEERGQGSSAGAAPQPASSAAPVPTETSTSLSVEEILRALTLSGSGDSGNAFDDSSDDGLGTMGYAGFRRNSYGEHRFKDLTACSSECGYCGDCDY